MKSKHFLSFLALAGLWLGLAHDSAHAGGPNDTAYGSGALASDTSGNFNSAFGNYALYFNQTGVNNTAMGYAALGYTTGTSNSALGAYALYLNTSGSSNSAIGTYALYTNTTGSFNTATGWGALAYSTGSNNSASGFEALYTNTSGSFNTATGLQALYTNTTGSNNIALGYQAGGALTTGSNNIDIGHQGVAGESNIIRIGDGSTQTDTYLTGVVHGNGSGLTNVPASATGTGAAEFVRVIQTPNDSVAPGTAFTIDTTVFNSIPVAIAATPGNGGTVFTLNTPGIYVLDYEMSLAGGSSVGLYKGGTPVTLVLDANTIAGSTTSTTWLHGRALVVVGSTPVVVEVSSAVGTASVVTAGTAAGNYMIRLTILKIQ